jgi:hypothetical protein
MNTNLLEEIVKHIFSNLSVIHSHFVNSEKSKSLMSSEFLLDKKLSFDLENNETADRKVWGCQISSEQKELKILLADCWQERGVPELYLIVQLKDAPAYGLFYVHSSEKEKDDRSFIACSVNDNDWMECSTYLQATFLAGMEQLKDLGLNWTKCKDYTKQYNLLLSLIKYHDSLFEASE